MHPRWLLTLGMLGAVCLPTAAENFEGAYTLAELKVLARSVHPTLESAQAGIEVATGQLRQARAHPNPMFAVAAGRGRPRDGGESRSESSFALVQPIEWPGLRKWRARAAEAGLRLAEIERGVVESIVDATVERLAYTVRGERQRAEIARESARVAERLHDLLARRVELGESSPLAAVKARTDWFARRRAVLDAESDHQAARSALDLFCAGRLSSAYELAETLDGAEAKALPEDLVDRLRARNPLLLRAVSAVDESAARVETAKKQTVPRIEIFAGHETELDRIATHIGAGLSIPVWNRNRGAVAAATATRARAAGHARALSMELETDLARASAEYERALAAIRLHREGWTAAARQSLDIATFSFENGEASLLDVLDAQRAYLKVRLAEASSRAALNLARAEIERLIGGPLESESIDETP